MVIVVVFVIIGWFTRGCLSEVVEGVFLVLVGSKGSVCSQGLVGAQGGVFWKQVGLVVVGGRWCHSLHFVEEVGKKLLLLLPVFIVVFLMFLTITVHLFLLLSHILFFF